MTILHQLVYNLRISLNNLL